MSSFSISGEGPEWHVFKSRSKDGRPVIVRSRLANAPLREFSHASFMARLRCVLPNDGVGEAGLPLSTDALDEFEDRLLTKLGDEGAQTYEVAVVTSDGCRDLFFAASEDGELLAAVREIGRDLPFKIELARLDGAKDSLLRSLTPRE